MGLQHIARVESHCRNIHGKAYYITFSEAIYILYQNKALLVRFLKQAMRLMQTRGRIGGRREDLWVEMAPVWVDIPRFTSPLVSFVGGSSNMCLWLRILLSHGLPLRHSSL